MHPKNGKFIDHVQLNFCQSAIFTDYVISQCSKRAFKIPSSNFLASQKLLRDTVKLITINLNVVVEQFLSVAFDDHRYRHCENTNGVRKFVSCS